MRFLSYVNTERQSIFVEGTILDALLTKGRYEAFEEASKWIGCEDKPLSALYGLARQHMTKVVWVLGRFTFTGERMSSTNLCLRMSRVE